MKHLIAILLLCLVPGISYAHTRSQSASDWIIDGSTLSGTFSIDARRATLLYGIVGSEGQELDDLLAQHLGQTIQLTQGDVECLQSIQPEQQGAAEGFLRFALSFECPETFDDRAARLRIGAIFPLSSAHLHIVRVRQEGELVLERVLTGDANRVVLGNGASENGNRPRTIDFVRTGVSHVLSGWDHLAFLAALLLLAGRLKPIIVTITGFTLGHSLTMALVALGALRPHGGAVEVLIGFSIAYAAMEAGASGLKGREKMWLWFAMAAAGVGLSLLMLGRDGMDWVPAASLIAVCWFVASQGISNGTREAGWSWRAPMLAVLFGLAHGAGFAGALLEYDLHGAGLVRSLLGFNLGVELGQLAAVMLILAAVVGVSRLSKLDIAVGRVPAASILFGLGIFWTVTRLIDAI